MAVRAKIKQKVTALVPHVKATHARAKKHYYTVMPNKKGHRILVWITFLTMSSIIGGQLLYSPDRVMPLARIGDQWVGGKTYTEMAELLTLQFDKTKVKLVTKGNRTVEKSLKLTGAEPNTGGMIDKLSDYPLWQRYIPFSILVPRMTSGLEVSYAGSVLKKFALSESQHLTAQPLNAGLTITDGRLVASSEKKGETVTEKAIRTALISTVFRVGGTTEIKVESKTTEPTRTTADFAQVKLQAELALAEQISIKVDGKTFSPNASDIASWLIIGSDEKGDATLGLDESKVNAYLETINEKVGTPAGMTNVTLVDGNETARSIGSTGRRIDSGALIAKIRDLLIDEKGSETMTSLLVDVAPTVVYNNTYSATEQGLRKYINDIALSKNMHISIQQIGGAGWSANARANESIPSASTYKLFVALMLFDKMDKNEIHWSDPMLDTNVDTCFDRMTIASTNSCAEQWLANWGRTNINNFVYAHGFSGGTSFTNPTATHTTAADLTKYMVALNSGTLMSNEHRDRLLHSLSVHPYRYGIPTGSAGKVYDKVGFLWDYIHDTAIVQHPRGTYVMTIMTQGQSYSAIAKATKEIERIMYP